MYSNKLFVILFLLLLLMISCSDNNKSVNRVNNRLEYLQSFGYEFYEDLDPFLLKGIKVIDTSNIEYPFYAIDTRDDSLFVDIQRFISLTNVFYTSFRKINNYYISTKVSNDRELSGFSYRNVSIVYPDRIILYDYFIHNDFERLTDISFLYKNGDKKSYYNTTDSYYNICDTVNENNIVVVFPTFEKDLRRSSPNGEKL